MSIAWLTNFSTISLSLAFSLSPSISHSHSLSFSLLRFERLWPVVIVSGRRSKLPSIAWSLGGTHATKHAYLYLSYFPISFYDFPWISSTSLLSLLYFYFLMKSFPIFFQVFHYISIHFDYIDLIHFLILFPFSAPLTTTSILSHHTTYLPQFCPLCLSASFPIYLPAFLPSFLIC